MVSFSQLPPLKKDTIFDAAQTKLGPSYFVRTLGILPKGKMNSGKNECLIFIFFRPELPIFYPSAFFNGLNDLENEWTKNLLFSFSLKM